MSRIPILIAQNRELDRQLAQRTLEFANFEPLLTSTNVETIEIARTRRPPVIILELEAPRAELLETALRIQEITTYYRPRILAVTSFDASIRYLDETWRESGVDRCLVRPVSPASLAAAVSRELAWLEGNDPSQLWFEPAPSKRERVTFRLVSRDQQPSGFPVRSNLPELTAIRM